MARPEEQGAPRVDELSGSQWHCWDPHIHTPGTLLNDQFGADSWDAFLTKIEQSSPRVEALGITDYLSIDRYVEVLERRAGRLQDVGLIFPNIEMRLGIETAKGSPVNLHILCSPHERDHVERIRRFLGELTFDYLSEQTFRCTREDLIRLGRSYNSKLTDERGALAEGANQFKVNFPELRKKWQGDLWMQRNALIAVAAGDRDGTSGLRDAKDSFAAQRKDLEAFAHVILSANPKNREFWLGRGAATPDELVKVWGGPKPCVHGSDAHDLDSIGLPKKERHCWIKGDLSFESLQQVCMEPEERIAIGAMPRRGGLPSHTIKEVRVEGASWIQPPAISVNPGLVAVIGARGSGKTALADLIAAGGYAMANSISDKSFLYRAKEYLDDHHVTLEWEQGEPTTSALFDTGFEEDNDARVRYLSQQFVDELCSSKGLADPLVREIQRVIFNAHPIDQRMEASSFDELLEIRSAGARAQRTRHEVQLTQCSSELADERALKTSHTALTKQHADKKLLIDKDKKDRSGLIGKGQEVRVKLHEQISEALDARRAAAQRVQRQILAIEALQADVKDFRTRERVQRLEDLAEERSDATLTAAEWRDFELDFKGDVDTLLAGKLRAGRALHKKIAGPAENEPVFTADADASKPLLENDAKSDDQTVSLLESELARLSKLIGVDSQKAKRFRELSDKISKDEAALGRLAQQISRAASADERIAVLFERRRLAYKGVFEAIVDLETELDELYGPLKKTLTSATGSLGKLSFSVRRIVDVVQWAAAGEALLDLRKVGAFKGNGTLLQTAKASLLPVWEKGDAEAVSKVLSQFIADNEGALRSGRLDTIPIPQWMRQVAAWLHSTNHITVSYGLEYGKTPIESLSQGTRGIVLLLLYLAIDQEDDRPLIIDQPEENLDPKSVFDELVVRFREAKQRRQIIIVTHNANMVVNTDADQVIVARCGEHHQGSLPTITYLAGGLENPTIRAEVCDILEGGETAFRERAKRLRIAQLAT